MPTNQQNQQFQNQQGQQPTVYTLSVALDPSWTESRIQGLKAILENAAQEQSGDQIRFAVAQMQVSTRQ